MVVGGSQGDLYVFVRVKEHADLRREGLTVHSDVSVSYVDAILGMHQQLLQSLSSQVKSKCVLPLNFSRVAHWFAL